MRLVLSVVVVSAVLLAVSVNAEELVLRPIADTSIYKGDGTSFDSVSDGVGPHLWLGQTAGGVTRRLLVRFDLSSVLPGSTVTSATLTLVQTRSRGDYEVSLHRLLTSWGEGISNGGDSGSGAAATSGDATWKYSNFSAVQWAAAGGDFAATASATSVVGPSAIWSSAGMVANAQHWVNAPAENFGWILIGDEATIQNAKRFESLQAPLSVQPELRLQITPVPEPSVYALMGIGVGLIGWRLRRRQARHQERRLIAAR